MAQDSARPRASGQAPRQKAALAAGDPDLALFDHARLPDGIEFWQVLASNRGLLKPAMPSARSAAQTIDDRAIIGDAVGGGKFTILRRSDPDLQIAGEPVRHRE